MTEKQKEGDVAYPNKLEKWKYEYKLLVKWKGLPSQSVKALDRRKRCPVFLTKDLIVNRKLAIHS
jgi:hypothetical protein